MDNIKLGKKRWKRFKIHFVKSRDMFFHFHETNATDFNILIKYHNQNSTLYKILKYVDEYFAYILSFR